MFSFRPEKAVFRAAKSLARGGASGHNAGMGKINRVLSALAAILVLASCGDPQSAPPLGPEEDHCARDVERLIKPEVFEGGAPLITHVSAATNEDIRNVRVRYDYPPNPEELEKGTILCTYAFPYEARNDQARIVKAQSVYFRGRYLSETELLLLNAALRGLKPDYKVKK